MGRQMCLETTTLDWNAWIPQLWDHRCLSQTYWSTCPDRCWSLPLLDHLIDRFKLLDKDLPPWNAVLKGHLENLHQVVWGSLTPKSSSSRRSSWGLGPSYGILSVPISCNIMILSLREIPHIARCLFKGGWHSPQNVGTPNPHNLSEKKGS